MARTRSQGAATSPQVPTASELERALDALGPISPASRMAIASLAAYQAPTPELEQVALVSCA